MSKQPIFRFAPSPNGELHLGHAYSALLNLKMAREIDGKILLRIENIDTIRCTPELEAQMLTDLEWIGFEWDEEPRRQSEHFDEYRSALEKLDARDLIYPSTLTRKQIKQLVLEKSEEPSNWPCDPDGAPLYPGTEKTLSKVEQAQIMANKEPYSLRLNMDLALEILAQANSWHEMEKGQISADPKAWGDVVLARKDTPTSYHLACVLDDAAQQVTHIVRGMDLYHATSVHAVLQSLLDLPKPIYHHHRLITDFQGHKLSKSEKPLSLRALREAGTSKNELLERLFDGPLS